MSKTLLCKMTDCMSTVTLVFLKVFYSLLLTQANTHTPASPPIIKQPIIRAAVFKVTVSTSAIQNRKPLYIQPNIKQKTLYSVSEWPNG